MGLVLWRILYHATLEPRTLSLVALFAGMVAFNDLAARPTRSAFPVLILYAWITGFGFVIHPAVYAEPTHWIFTISIPIVLALLAPPRILATPVVIIAAVLATLCSGFFVTAFSQFQPGRPITILILLSPAVALGPMLLLAIRDRSAFAIVTAAALLVWCATFLLSARYLIRDPLELLLIPTLLLGPLACLFARSKLAATPGVLQLPGAVDSPERDALTGVHNRRALDTRGRKLYDQMLKTDRPISVLMLDIDHFKQVNDLYGHAAGDVALAHFAQVIGNQVRGTDFVARYGGEEFTILLPSAPLAPAMRLAEKMRQAVQDAEILHGERKLKVTTSVGVTAAFPGDEATFAQALARADKNLYRAKRNGRNRVMADPLPGEL